EKSDPTVEISAMRPVLEFPPAYAFPNQYQKGVLTFAVDGGECLEQCHLVLDRVKTSHGADYDGLVWETETAAPGVAPLIREPHSIHTVIDVRDFRLGDAVADQPTFQIERHRNELIDQRRRESADEVTSLVAPLGIEGLAPMLSMNDNGNARESGGKHG